MIDSDELERRLEIAFSEEFTNEQKCSMVMDGTRLERRHEAQVRESGYWLRQSPDHKVIWAFESGFPDFRPLEKRLPFALFYVGSLTGLHDAVTIVGTRKADYPALHEAFRLSLDANANGLCVVSGMAEGIDQAALDASFAMKRPSISVLGCGLEYDYPSYSGVLKKRIVENGGAVVSQFAPDTPPMAYNFPNRNQILAAMGNVCVAIQAPRRSGTLITVDFALQMGKDVYISREGIGKQHQREGTDSLHEEGAPVIEGFSSLTAGKDRRVRVYDSGKANTSSFGYRFCDRMYCVEVAEKCKR